MTKEESPESEASYRFAKNIAIVLGALIVVALVALLIGFAVKARQPGGSDEHRVVLPAGARIISLDVVSGRIVVRSRSPAGDEIDILDASDGHVITSIKPGAPARD